MNDRQDTGLDDDFASKAKSRFDESVDHLDAETRSRLNRGRQAALAGIRPSRPLWIQWVPAAGVAAAAVVAVILWTGNRPPTVPASTVVDLEILLDEDSLEMLEELEFYSWIELAEEPVASPQAGDQVG